MIELCEKNIQYCYRPSPRSESHISPDLLLPPSPIRFMHALGAAHCTASQVWIERRGVRKKKKISDKQQVDLPFSDRCIFQAGQNYTIVERSMQLSTLFMELSERAEDTSSSRFMVYAMVG